jgi:hypothetical protein
VIIKLFKNNLNSIRKSDCAAFPECCTAILFNNLKNFQNYEKKPDLRGYSLRVLKKLLMKIGIALLFIIPAISVSPKVSAAFVNYDELQQKQVTGKVTDASGNSLPGVSVVVKGTVLGTLSDISGKYTLSNVPQDATLVFLLCRNGNAGSSSFREDSD